MKKDLNLGVPDPSVKRRIDQGLVRLSAVEPITPDWLFGLVYNLLGSHRLGRPATPLAIARLFRLKTDNAIAKFEEELKREVAARGISPAEAEGILKLALETLEKLG